MRTAVVTAESNQRGYLISDDAQFLEPYRAAAEGYVRKLDQLAELTADNPIQQKRIGELRPFLEARFSTLAESIEQHDREGPEAARAVGRQRPWPATDGCDPGPGGRVLQHGARTAGRATTGQSAGVSRGFGGGRRRGPGRHRGVGRLFVAAPTPLPANLAKRRRNPQAAGAVAGHARQHWRWGHRHRRQQPDHVPQRRGRIAHRLVTRRCHGKGPDPRLPDHQRELSQPGREPGRPGDPRGADHGTGQPHDPGRPRRQGMADRRQRGADPQSGRLDPGCGAGISRDQRAEAARGRVGAKSQQLEEADRRKDEFLAMLRDELRNPLAPLSNALHLWSLEPQNHEFIDGLRGTFERQVQQLVRLVNDLLDVSRISEGKIRLHKQSVAVQTLIDEALEVVKPSVDSLSQRLVVGASEEPLAIEANVARMVQVFGNILNNASKYSGRGGTIWVTTERDGDRAVVKVRDNGPGIPPHLLGAIFDLFRQADNTLDRAHGGLGIGLTLVKRLVEAHGGTVAAHSQGPGSGTEIVVSLPLAASNAVAADQSPVTRLRQVMGLPRRRVLVVNDVEASATTMAMLLRALGQEVAARFDGPSALEFLPEFKPNVVLLDISMPGMDGYEVARRIRALPELSGITLVALTGYGQEEDRRLAFEAGFDKHLVKPISLEALEQLLLTLPLGVMSDAN